VTDTQWPTFTQQTGYTVNTIYDVSPTFLGDLSAYFTQNPFPVPISQVSGFEATTPYQAPTIAAEETTSSNTYVDLTTLGPQLTSVPDGKYVIHFGSAASISSTTTRARMGIQINAATVDNSQAGFCSTTTRCGISFATLQTVSGGTSGNTITCKYAIGAGASGASATFGARWLLALRVSGP
jgi:hypothetical protein